MTDTGWVHAEPDPGWDGLQPEALTWVVESLDEARRLARRQARSPGWSAIWYGTGMFTDAAMREEPCWSTDRPNEFRYPAGVGYVADESGTT